MHCISNSFNVTNGVHQSRILYRQPFSVYITGLGDSLNKSTIGGSLGGKRINHIVYADTFCNASLSSAGY